MIFTDQTGHSFELNCVPKRIVSIVPSQTELLADLGLEKEVAGITRFCVHPSTWYSSKTRVGGTKDPKIDMIRSLRPDLIIANKEENRQDDIVALREDFPVYVSDVNTLGNAQEMIRSVGEMTGTVKQAERLNSEIQTAFHELDDFIESKQARPYNVLYFIWKNPWMVAGSDTFISDMIDRCGWTNVASASRYPEVDICVHPGYETDLILLSSEPYPFRSVDQKELKDAFPDARILLVDGEFFSWYGSRLRHAPAYFKKLIGAI